MLRTLLRSARSRSQLPNRLGFGTHARDDCKSIFLLNVEGKRNLSPLLIGLFEHFENVLGPGKVGFFQPVAGEPFPGSKSSVPRHVELMHSVFGLLDAPESMVAVSRRECVDLQAEGKEDELLDRVYERFQAYGAGKELVLLEGTHIETFLTADGPVYSPGNRLALNGKLAATLSSPVAMVLDAGMSGALDLVSRALICKKTLEDCRANVTGLILNQVRDPQGLESLAEEVRGMLEARGSRLLGAVPYSQVLASTRLDEIQLALKATLLQRHSRMDVGIDQVFLGSGTLDQTLGDLKTGKAERALVLCDASRSDLLLGLSAAHGSRAGPHVAGLLITGGEPKAESVRTIMQGAGQEGSQLVQMATELGAYQAAQRISAITPDILPSSSRKIEESKQLIAKRVLLDQLDAAVQAEQADPSTITPKRFMHNINRICQEDPQRIVLPEGMEPRVLQAAAEASRKGLARITLLGVEDAVRAEARRLGLDISGCDIMDHRSSPHRQRYAELLQRKRAHKGMTLEKANDLLEDFNYFGTLMAASGDADGMVSGSTTTTANTIRPALQVLKGKGALISSVFFMCLPTKVLVYGDCAVNTDPNAEQLAQIGITSADTAAAFGIEPRVAFLSYSTLGSGAGPDVDKVTEAVRLAKQMRPDLMIEGPIQYDAAVDPGIARTKIKGESQVAGRASVLIVPDLQVGNIVYKAVQQSTGGAALGPIMAGLTAPVNDLSRGCTVADILNTITCTGVQAIARSASQAEAGAAPAA